MKDTALLKTDSVDAVDSRVLHAMVREDQLLAVRRSMLTAIPVNVLLALTGMFVAMNAGLGRLGMIWFALAAVVNAGRALLCRLDYRGAVERHLRITYVAAGISGLVWALVPILCAGFTAPQTLFYLVVVAGVTAGAVTYGNAYAPVPVAFITPPLLSAAGCLFYAGGFDRTSLAIVVMLYLVALIRSAFISEHGFRENSRLKNEATTLAHSLRDAHAYEQELAKEMHRRALHDALTGLHNREGFMHAAAPLLASGDDKQLCLLMLDLDGFKAINDVFGHKAGDRVLTEVGHLLQRELAPLATVTGRWGGDEFAVLYVVQGKNDAPHQVAGQIIAAIAATTVHQSSYLGASIGIYVGRKIPIDDMIVFADAALYEAKRGGRNQYHLFDDLLRQRLDTRRDVERDLPGAIAERRLEVWYQPIVNPADRQVDSVEALLRWHHPRHGWLAPEDIIFIAANIGQSEALLRTILSNVCRCQQSLADIGISHLRIAMNVSPREMSRLPINEMVREVLASEAMPTSLLEIEITEETALDIDAVQQKLSALAESGVRIAVDDFGVGYSSLSSLRSEHVHRVKIDRSFVHGLAQSQENKVLVESILNLGRSLGLEVVAEGVEHEADMQALRELGCGLIQGFYIARPMPLNALLKWLTPA